MSFPRSLRSRELIQGVLNHPLFDPTFQWSQQQHLQLEEFNGNLQFVVFLDVETCFESNYPLYSKGSLKNLDTDHHRQLYTHPGENKRSCYKFDITGVSKEHPRKGHCPYIDDILRSPFFQSHPNTARLVIFDCQGNGVDTIIAPHATISQLSLVSLSSTAPQLKPEYDLGLPPPAVNPIRLSKSQRDKILSCQGEDDDQILGVPEGHRFGYYLTCIASVQKRTPTRRTLYD
ncbi:expressed unknown protein [Seminavis robusta]|uniref:Uncharacterized protein n=1 Tax=Seminavis robusta TaxID=568900 RepID=A0A9N8DGX4_9STRA|nr:expressed unknown protein [Seminavis robusta]|eukprot:Sro85_g045260.1 n/a (232) ;mRNA; r:38558-39253